MAVSIPLEHMSIEEKIQAMEMMWDDLCHQADGIASPPWHEEVLLGREEHIKFGDSQFTDWESAKKNIKRESE